MCGICGRINFDPNGTSFGRNTPVSDDLMHRMCDTIIHRGPDSEGIFNSQSQISNPKSQIPRKGFFISAGGTKGENLFTGTILTVKYFFKAINVDYSSELVYNKIDTKGAIRKHPTALKDAFEAGKKLASN